ncbi:hypothetical protein HID58_087830 [Brassica napus]|uniref:Uncharacterized protein n=1 Tax=Brassica napus TaxID=3708 RepID=A0ABQ7XUF1_BRANA|nr:hypothetical protein HID58_087830 [Brassica napus]
MNERVFEAFVLGPSRTYWSSEAKRQARAYTFLLCITIDEAKPTDLDCKKGPDSGLVGWTMKKGIHPQMQWISYVTQSGRLMHVMMTRIHHVGKVYHFGAKRQLAQSIGQIAKFKRRFNEQEEEPSHDNNNIDNQKK